jgi:hypothetical protein
VQGRTNSTNEGRRTEEGEEEEKEEEEEEEVRMTSQPGWVQGLRQRVTHIGVEGLLERPAHHLGAQVRVLEVRHTGDAPVRL